MKIEELEEFLGGKPRGFFMPFNLHVSRLVAGSQTVTVA
jgi:hypothetical protein